MTVATTVVVTPVPVAAVVVPVVVPVRAPVPVHAPAAVVPAPATAVVTTAPTSVAPSVVPDDLLAAMRALVADARAAQEASLAREQASLAREQATASLHAELLKLTGEDRRDQEDTMMGNTNAMASNRIQTLEMIRKFRDLSSAMTRMENTVNSSEFAESKLEKIRDELAKAPFNRLLNA